MTRNARLSTDFHRRRLDAVRGELARRQLDALLVMNPVNVYYLTGYWYNPAGVMERPVFVLVAQDHEPALFVSLDVYGHSDGTLSPAVDNIHVYAEYPYAGGQPTITWICDRIAELGLRGRTLGAENNFMPINDGVSRPWYDQVADAFDGRVVPAGDLVNRMRLVKEPEEIELLRLACSYADALVTATSEELRVGRTEEDVGATARARVEAAMRDELSALVPSLATGQLVAGTPHVYHDTRRDEPASVVRAGVPIIINCFATVGGYHGESERCGLLGTPTARQRELFEIAMESQLRARDAVRAGARAGDVDAVAKTFIEAAGFDYLYGVGHGIGLLGHEPPWVREGSNTILEAGMCITVEPGLAVPREGSFHCSQTVLVTETGCEPLTVADGIHRFDLP